jgi:hypothetical protein
MNLAIKITLAASGIFLLVGMIGGILKYRAIIKSPQRKAPLYIDMAHRAAFLYSIAALVMAELLKFSPYSEKVQLVISGVPLFFFAVAIGEYFKLGLQNKITNQFEENNFNTTWGMLFLIIGELGGVGAIVWGFLSTQFLG